MSSQLEESSDEEDFYQSLNIDDLVHTYQSLKTQDDLKVLYFLAKNDSLNTGTYHHGVSCNICGASPIQGIRYHCIECPDVDICCGCESQKIHKFHSLLKISIPIPLGLSPKTYKITNIPGSLQDIRYQSLSKSTLDRLAAELQVVPDTIHLLYEKFCALADVLHYTGTNTKVHGISKKRFLSLLEPPISNNALAKACFQYYDQNNEGVISFSAFAKGRHILNYPTSLQCISQGIKAFDFIGNGYFSLDTVGCVLLEYFGQRLKIDMKTNKLVDIFEGIRVSEGHGPLSTNVPYVRYFQENSKFGDNKEVQRPLKTFDIWDLGQKLYNESISGDSIAAILGVGNKQNLESVVDALILQFQTNFKINNPQRISIENFLRLYVSPSNSFTDSLSKSLVVFTAYSNLCAI